MCRAHPRSRGENDAVVRRLAVLPGSSPLTRGKPNPPHNARNRGRLIPAHAGKTSRSGAGYPCHPAHPRSRGENITRVVRVVCPHGSSPLTRGKPLVSERLKLGKGLIPAHAGKTIDGFIGGIKSAAHPRSRGENSHPGWIGSRSSGSSPLTRGKLCDLVPVLRLERLIPAHAGKTSGRGLRTNAGPAHPRSRGENGHTKGTVKCTSGSSPLTRGKPDGKLRTSNMSRLIPAHAGKTTWYLVPLFGTTAHPRSRGENGQDERGPLAPRGSSPLTRGKRRGGVETERRSRLIPAHAGKTLLGYPASRRAAAHPRSRGENMDRQPMDQPECGSSPLTRGKRSCRR